MVICKFYPSGTCKFGEYCRFEHPQTNQVPRLSQNPNQSQNRFSALSRDHGPRSNSDPRQTSNQLPYRLDKERVRADLTEDRPIWILSSYSPTQETPRQLFGGASREQSFEELRWRHYELAAIGQEQQAIQEAKDVYESSEQQIRAALNNLDGALKYIIDGRNEHPNRIDICRDSPDRGVPSLESAARTQPRPSSIAQGSVFGQPSKPTQLQSFGQPSALNRPSNPFAKTFDTQPAFGQPSQLGKNLPGVPGQPRNPFAQATEHSKPGFGAPTSGASGLGGSDSMEVAENSNRGFGSGTSTAINTSPFGLPTSSKPSSSTNTLQPSSFSTGVATNGAQNTRINTQGRVDSWKGKQVHYLDGKPCFKRPDGKWERVWFPLAPNVPQEEVAYGRSAEATKESYRFARENGIFKDGVMPELPPIKEWSSWDF